MRKSMIVSLAALGTWALVELPTACAERSHPCNTESDVSEAAPALDEQAVAAEMATLYQELVARLDERGVSDEELQAAVDAGDAERVRELFGFTPEEYAEVNARALAVAANVLAYDETSEAHPEGLRCEKGVMECGAPYMLAAWAQPQFGAAFLVFGAMVCGIARCEWDDGSGPRPKQK